ncbi:MAG: class I SAM-dependent methyltransferase [Candidatus Peribacteraceae bacterium]|nr:class I SAM-dependent methyltransferase [Candidatus Peribacteraceae bacterium]MDD5741903.1 class I SAM-dependent methyltransferase [Candidatus Peribacteraceae bacterium]
MMDAMDRKQYWNRAYLEYWKRRVDESASAGRESTVVAGDVKTEGDEVYEMIFSRHPPHLGSVLDVGCAWGRMFRVFKTMDLRITGIDISKAMIDQATADWGKDPSVDGLYEGEAESMPFRENLFDNVACLAVFDALYQDRALAEFFRVLRMDGLLYLTGKNDTYPMDDDPAIRAEAGARAKHHPNYFTDTAEMLRQIREHGHMVLATYFFPRRGDFGRLHAVTGMPDAFYEYFVVIQKKAQHGLFQPFSDSASKTFLRLPQSDSRV